MDCQVIERFYQSEGFFYFTNFLFYSIMILKADLYKQKLKFSEFSIINLKNKDLNSFN